MRRAERGGGPFANYARTHVAGRGDDPRLLRNQPAKRSVYLTMKTFAVALLCALLAGCASPTPSATPTPTHGATPTPTPTSSLSPPPSFAVSPAPSFRTTCLPDRVLPLGSNGGPTADECSAILPFEAVAARLGAITRVFIKASDFWCGDLWLPWGSPPPTDCAVPQLGSAMSGWASFEGTDNVAAISVRRSQVGPKSPVVFGPWHASLEAFTVPPADWIMPCSPTC